MDENMETGFAKECLQKPPENSGSSFQPKGYTEEVCEGANPICVKAHVGRSHTS